MSLISYSVTSFCLDNGTDVSLCLNTTATKKGTGLNRDEEKQMIFPYLNNRQG